MVKSEGVWIKCLHKQCDLGVSPCSHSSGGEFYILLRLLSSLFSKAVFQVVFYFLPSPQDQLLLWVYWQQALMFIWIQLPVVLFLGWEFPHQSVISETYLQERVGSMVSQSGLPLSLGVVPKIKEYLHEPPPGVAGYLKLGFPRTWIWVSFCFGGKCSCLLWCLSFQVSPSLC